MRWQLMAIAAWVGISSEASAQYLMPPQYYPPVPQVWQPVRTRWVDNHCVPTRVVYLAPRPVMPVYPMPMPMPFPVINPLAQGLPPFQMAQFPQQAAPPMAAAPQPLPVQPILGNAAAPTNPVAAAPVRRPLAVAAPRMEQTVSKPTQEASPEEEAARKLKMARYLEQDGLMDKARQRYEEIVRLYPNTPAANEARQALGQGG